MRLYVDQGNSRIKLWLIDDRRIRAEAVCDSVSDAARWLAGLDVSALAAQVSSVAGQRADEALTQALMPWVVTWCFARVDPARLPTVYAEPGRLGVDRWLAVLAATPAAGAAIVVDAGTAFTVDALSAEGRHLGGYILPGLSLQRDALAARTARVSFPDPDWSEISWGDSTSRCVCQGSLQALVALVQAATARLQAESGVVPRVLLTGGDARHVLPHLRAEHHPLLVLEGLAVYGRDERALAAIRLREGL